MKSIKPGMKLKFTKTQSNESSFSPLISVLLLTSCGNDQLILPQSVGSFGKILVVTDNSKWQGDLGKEIRKTFGRLWQNSHNLKN